MTVRKQVKALIMTIVFVVCYVLYSTHIGFYSILDYFVYTMISFVLDTFLYHFIKTKKKEEE